MGVINSRTTRTDIQRAVTLSGNVIYEKDDFNGSNILFLSTNNTTTRTLTISNTGFVANDMIMLLIDQNSSGNVSVTIGSRAISDNRGNIINAIFDGTNWHVWSGGGVFNTSSSVFTRTSFGLRANTSNSSTTAYGHSSSATGASSSAYGSEAQASATSSSAFGESSVANANNSSAYGRASQATADSSSSFGVSSVASGSSSNAFGRSANANADEVLAMGRNTNTNSFVRSNVYGNYSRSRRYGATRFHLGTTTSSTDATNPSQNKEWATWNGTTTNDTITEIFLRGVSSNRCVLQAKNVISFRGQAVAFRSDYTGTARWSIEGLIKRDGSNNTTLVGVTTTLTHSDGTGGTLVLTITADDTNEALRVEVTGNASESWTWLVELELLDLRIA